MGASEVTVQNAGLTDLTAVMNVLDGANLAAEAEEVRDRIAAGTVLVATADDTVVGTLVYRSRDDAIHVTAVAVRRRWRDQGTGTTLVETLASRGTTLIAEFDPPVRPFYEALGFDIDATPDGRLRGRRKPASNPAGHR